MSFDAEDAEDVLEDVANVLDEIDPERASEQQLRSVVRRISDLVATADDGEGEEDEEDEDDVEVEEGDGEEDEEDEDDGEGGGENQPSV